MLASLVVASMIVPMVAAAPPAPQLSVGQILEREAPAIVAVYSEDANGDTAFGTGFIVRSSGVILTNFHVIRGAQKATVRLKTNEIYDRVWVLDYDERRDIAVLKIQAKGLPTVRIGDSEKVKLGDVTIAIGNPKGMDHTVSNGIVSARRVIEGTEYIQTTAPISHGSSGGPLYDGAGRVIGITTISIEGGQALNFAIPLKYALPLLDAPGDMHTVAEVTAMTGPRPAGPAAAARTADERGLYLDPSGTFAVKLPPGWRAKKPDESMLMSFENQAGTASMFVVRLAGDAAPAAQFGAIVEQIGKLGRLEPDGDTVETERVQARWFKLTTENGRARSLAAVVRTDHGSLYFLGLAEQEAHQAQEEMVKLFMSLQW